MIEEFEGDKMSDGSIWAKSHTNNNKQKSNVGSNNQPVQSIIQFDALNNSNSNVKSQNNHKNQ